MGRLSSPFETTRIFACRTEVVIDDWKDKANPFYWDSVVQNCLGTNEYYLSMPRLYWWDSKLQVITAACKTFLDDSRSVTATQKLSRDSTHSVEKVMVYLGLQDAIRKRRLNP